VGGLVSVAGWALGNAGIDVSHDGARAAIETAGVLVPALAGFLVLGRARRTASQADVLLAAMLFVWAVVNLAVGLLPAVLAARQELFAGWTPDAARLVPAIGFVAAAFCADRSLEQPQRRAMQLIALSLVFVALVIVAGVALDRPMRASGLTLTPSGRLLNDAAHSAAVAATLGTFAALLCGSAAAGFMVRAQARGDQLMTWGSAGLGLVAIARVDAIAFPNLWTADVLRVAALVAVIIGALREIGTYQRAVAEAAVARERRRMARDLHDGLAQDLAYITAHSRRLASTTDRNGRSSYELLVAAERALEESRLAIASLTRAVDEPLERSLANAALSAGARAGVEMVFDLDEDVQVAPEVREALLRIVREAIGNAARHGEAQSVRVEVRADDGLVLSVRDDGKGFDPASPRRPDSFGLESMRERVETVGGRLAIDSAVGGPTTIRVELP